jgi:type IV protein arginine methyltransferase
MMDWEDELMTRHAERLLPRHGLRALNIGHGMGIVDAAIQSHEPGVHHIVEAHPAVLSKMRQTGWFEKPGVQVHEGRWQDVLPRLVEQGIEVDAIYYDIFAEDYKDFKELFSEHVIGLWEQSGRFGFYNGLGADRRVCSDVYTSVCNI